VTRFEDSRTQTADSLLEIGLTQLSTDFRHFGKDNLKKIRSWEGHFFTRLKSNRQVNPDDTHNRAVREVEIPEEGLVVHLKGFGFARVFRTGSTDRDAKYWATNDLDMTEEKRLLSARLCVPSFIALIAALLVGLPPGVVAQETEPSPMRFWRWSYGDALGAARAADGETALYVLGGAATLAALSPLDEPIVDEAERLRESRLEGAIDLANPLGHNYAALPAAGLFAASLFADAPRFQEAAFTSVQAYVYTRAVGDALKSIVGRRRPTAGEGAYAFDPLGGPTSFPSGHTVTTFALLTPWVAYYPHPLTYGLYGVAGATAVARVAEQDHWPTDVLASAALAVGIGTWLSRRHQRQSSSGKMQLSFTGGGLGLQIRLP